MRKRRVLFHLVIIFASSSNLDESQRAERKLRNIFPVSKIRSAAEFLGRVSSRYCRRNPQNWLTSPSVALGA